MGLREKQTNILGLASYKQIRYRKLTSSANKTLKLSRRSGGGGGTSGPSVVSRAGGGSASFSESFKGKIVPNSISKDQEGRMLSVIVEINDTTFHVCNVY